MKTSINCLQKMFFLLVMGFSICAVQACSDDDPVDEGQGGGAVASGKKIAKIVVDSEWGKYTDTFSYDEKGRLMKVISTSEYEDSEPSTYTIEYIWGDDIIRQIGDNSGTYILEDGLIQEGHCFYDFDFTYNKSNKFVELTYYRTYTAIWDGNKLMSISSEKSDNRFMYEGKTCKGYLPPCTAMFHMDTDGESLFTAHPEIAGMLTNQLPSARICDGEKTTYTYEFDKNGYVSKIVEKGDDNEIKTIYLTWR